MSAWPGLLQRDTSQKGPPMIDANAYHIRISTAADSDTLSGLAERHSQKPLVGRVLIGYIDGTPAAALSLHDGRVIADNSAGRVVASPYARERHPGLRGHAIAAPATPGGASQERGRSVAAPVTLRHPMTSRSPRASPVTQPAPGGRLPGRPLGRSRTDPRPSGANTTS